MVFSAGWLGRQQAEAIDYLRAVNKILMNCLEGRIILTDAERAKLAVHGVAMDSELLKEFALIVQP